MFKEWRGTKIFYPYILSAFLPPHPLILVNVEDITGCTNEAAKGADKAQRNLFFFCFLFILCFVSVITSTNTSKSSNDFMILIISFISSFKINKVNPALAAPFPLIFLSNLFIAFEVKLLTNPGELSLGKGTAIC